MTDTDRAFIAAFQERNRVASRSAGEAGPHFQSVAARRPRRARLSEVMALSEAAVDHIEESPKPSTRATGIEIKSFSWPQTVERICNTASGPLSDLLDAVRSAETGGAVALVAASPGVGLTSTVLALARIAGRAGMRVALLDAAPTGCGLTNALHFHRLPTLRETLQRGLLPETAEVYAERDGASFTLVGNGWEQAAASEALADIRKTADLVILELGAVPSAETPDVWATAGAPVVLVEGPMDDAEEHKRLLNQLRKADARVLGVVQNLVAA